MYLTHKATERHDKVYALLGMSSDDIINSLLPHYRVPWETLFQDLVKFLSHEKISVETLGDKQTARIKSKGCILGKVSSVQSDIGRDNSPGVDVTFKTTSSESGYIKGWSVEWTLHASANPSESATLSAFFKELQSLRLSDYVMIILILS
jgi:hypothetical protein